MSDSKKDPDESGLAKNPDNQHILDAMGIISEYEAEKMIKKIRKERDEEWT